VQGVEGLSASGHQNCNRYNTRPTMQHFMWVVQHIGPEWYITPYLYHRLGDDKWSFQSSGKDGFVQGIDGLSASGHQNCNRYITRPTMQHFMANVGPCNTSNQKGILPLTYTIDSLAEPTNFPRLQLKSFGDRFFYREFFPRHSDYNILEDVH
jgi:hypothetical protein